MYVNEMHRFDFRSGSRRSDWVCSHLVDTDVILSSVSLLTIVSCPLPLERMIVARVYLEKRHSETCSGRAAMNAAAMRVSDKVDRLGSVSRARSILALATAVRWRVDRLLF